MSRQPSGDQGHEAADLQDEAPEADDKVGYRRPPKGTRFQPGQSGNPRGRPRGAKSLTTCFEDELRKPVTVTVAGKRRTMTKAEAIATQHVNKAMSGDPKTLPLLLGAERLRQGGAGPAAGRSTEPDPVEDLCIADLVQRIRATAPPAPCPGSAAAAEPLDPGATAPADPAPVSNPDSGDSHD